MIDGADRKVGTVSVDGTGRKKDELIHATRPGVDSQSSS
jgi:hypothetical protein